MRRSSSSISSGFEIDLHAEPARRLVHQVDRLVGQEPVGDVAVRQGRGRDDGRILDAHAVVQLVLLLEAAQDRDGVLDRRLVDEHRLEAAGERRILLDMLAVLVERGGADAVQLAAGQRRLQHVGCVHRALGRARADQSMQLVDEQDHVAFGRLDLLQDALEALLELAAELGAGDQRAQVEPQKAPVLQAFRHVAIDDAEREPLDDGGLANTRLTDQHRVVLGAAGENLNRPADLVVAPDDGVELAVARGLGQVAGEFLQRLVAVLGRRRVGGTALAHLLDGGVEPLGGNARVGERAARLGRGREREGEQQPLGGDVAVARLLGDLLGLVEQLGRLGREKHLARAALHLGHLAERRLDRFQRLGGVAARGADQVRGQPLLVLDQDFQDVLGRKLLVVGAQRERLGGLDEALYALGVFFEFHSRQLPNETLRSSGPLYRRAG